MRRFVLACGGDEGSIRVGSGAARPRAILGLRPKGTAMTHSGGVDLSVRSMRRQGVPRGPLAVSNMGNRSIVPRLGPRCGRPQPWQRTKSTPPQVFYEPPLYGEQRMGEEPHKRCSRRLYPERTPSVPEAQYREKWGQCHRRSLVSDSSELRVNG